MTIPAGIRTVRVRGRFRRPDGVPYKGTLTFQVPAIIEMDEALTMVAGTATVQLDENGEFSILLAATDQGDPSGWVYNVVLLLDDGTTRPFSLALPSSVPEVDLTKIMPSDPAQLNYVPVKGERGTSILSAAGLPAAGDGAVGDLWLDTASNVSWSLYGPKTVAGWPASGLPLGGGSFWRARDLPDPQTAEALYAGPAPTITVNKVSTPAVGLIKYSPDPVPLTGNDRRGPFTWAGATGVTAGTGTPDNTYVQPTSRFPNAWGSQANWSVEFGTDASSLQLRFKHISLATMLRLWINGRRVTDLMQPSGGASPSGDGATHFMTIDFGSAAPRRIRFDFTAMPFGGIYIPPTASLWATTLHGVRFMTLTDSLGDGSAHNVGAGCGTWVDRVGRLLGSSDIWREGRGSTGYVNPGGHATFGVRAEVDVIPHRPDILVVWGGYNDASSDQTQIQAAATALFTRLKTALPRCQIFIIGCWSPTGSPAPSHTNTTATLRAAAAAAGFPFVSPQTGGIYNSAGALVATQGAWITGTGNVSSPKGDGNADFYVGGDGVHPTDDGHTYLAGRIHSFLRAVLPA
ncbi:SGNH/GDSL hydrolase family protein [Streptomyces sp. NPDC091201]|uniref:SGNH/GDSL hydrolase family protein n=1 Tax=Streptomyces sp. NPDC091201 TaxID=3155190 RepID=UPI00343FA97B